MATGGGVVAPFASAEQREAMERVGGLMSLLEGHGDVTMDRAALDQVPSAERFARAPRTCKEMDLAAKLLQRMIGLEGELARARTRGAVHRRGQEVGGPAPLNWAFERPEHS